jgi:anti-sigma B factor antagonist
MAELNPGKQAPITVTTRREGDTPVVILSGELDLSNTEHVRSYLEDALAGGNERLVFELSNLEFMDSSGIALLASAAQRVQEVEIRDPPATVRRLLELTGLTEILRIVS